MQITKTHHTLVEAMVLLLQPCDGEGSLQVSDIVTRSIHSSKRKYEAAVFMTQCPQSSTWYALCLFLGSGSPPSLRQEIAGAGAPLAEQGRVT